jgi:hypothetical protein
MTKVVLAGIHKGVSDYSKNKIWIAYIALSNVKMVNIISPVICSRESLFRFKMFVSNFIYM